MTNIVIGFKMCRNKKYFCNNLFISDKTDFGLWMDRNFNRILVCLTVAAVGISLAMKSEEGGTKRAWVSDEKILQEIRDRSTFIAKRIEGGEVEISDAINSAPSANLSFYDLKIIELPRGYQKNTNLVVLVDEINGSVEQIRSLQSFRDASLAFTDINSQNEENKAIANSKK